MDLIKITTLTNQLGISSRSLRYYEQAGLIQSIRSDFEKYRYYDAENVERLKQIMVLRKMQIPIKDILRIYESADMSVVVETFVKRIGAIDDEIGALSEMKHITNEFLQTMLQNGITRISALPLLYEEMEKELTEIQTQQPIRFADLSRVSAQLAKPLEPVILSLPAMRMISSCPKANPSATDPDGFWRWLQAQQFGIGEPGRHEQFEYQSPAGEVFMQRIPADFENNSDYCDSLFEGGLFASVHVYLDEDLGECFRALIQCFDENPFYEIAYTREGALRHPALLESLIATDDTRELAALLVPVKKRLADPALFDPPRESAGLSVAKIEAANPVLWAVSVPPCELTPTNPHGGYIRYEPQPNGELIFSTYVGNRYLSTNVAVRLPFRVDFTCKYDVSPPNADTGFRFHFGNHLFAVNERNDADPALSKHALIFDQPIFGNQSVYPQLGKVKKGEYNEVSWIVGEKHLAAIINGELRFCAENLPYMKSNFQHLPAHPILLDGGGDMPITLQKVTVSQLETKKKAKTKKGELTMITKQSNNTIPNINSYCDGAKGENFAFDGACERLMECLGETDFGYWLIAGITGDCYAQVYPKNRIFFSDRYCVSDYNILYREDCADDIEGIFDKLGYACSYVPKEKIRANKEMYRQTLLAYIDKGIPVIHYKGNFSLICGYEEYGNILLCKNGCTNEFTKFVPDDDYFSDEQTRGWIFVGEKKEQKALADIYRAAVLKMSEILTTETDWYYFGAEAFRAWAQDIESGFYDGKTPQEADLWETHTSFVCDFETIAATVERFLTKAVELNPELGFLLQTLPIFKRQGTFANGGLEKLGGGFNVTLKTLQNKKKRTKIADMLRVFADNMDEIVQILRENGI